MSAASRAAGGWCGAAIRRGEGEATAGWCGRGRFWGAKPVVGVGGWVGVSGARRRPGRGRAGKTGCVGWSGRTLGGRLGYEIFKIIHTQGSQDTQ